MIRRGDQHRVDIFSLEETPIIKVAVPFADSLGAVDAALVNVARGDDLDVLLFGLFDETPEVASAHSTSADQADADAVVGPGGAGLGERGAGDSPGGEGGRFDKAPAGESVFVHRLGIRC